VRRRLFNLYYGASVALLLTASVFWVRGYRQQDLPQLCYQWYPHPLVRDERWLSVRSANGRFEFGIVRNDFDMRWALGVADEDVAEVSRLAEGFSRDYPQGFVWNYSVEPIRQGVGYATVGDGGLGFGVLHEGRRALDRHDEYWTVSVPAWFVILLCLIAPALWCRQRLRLAFRQKSGLCQKCGYDLRASKDRCPECGTARPAGGGEAA
jgi:hypothetical protein